MGCPRNPSIWTPEAPYGASTGTKDFDLTSSSTDFNGSPSNPRWAPQVQKPQNLPPTAHSGCSAKRAQPYEADCTDQSKYVVQDTGSGLSGALCTLFGDSSSISGHADWTAASGQGTIGWLNFADDWDYNLALLPENGYGLTSNNNKLPNGDPYLEVEFDSRELESRFGTRWWQDFAKLAEAGTQAGDYTQVQDHLHAGPGLPFGVVYGIFGVDCEHGCRSEFHPAYAVAIQVDDSKQNNTWAIFVRNWGDEGFCSHLDHQLDISPTGQAIHLVLPYKSSAGPTIIKQEFASSTAQQSQCPYYNFVSNQGEEITLPLPSPTSQGLAEIVVTFSWPDSASPIEHRPVEKKQLLQTPSTPPTGAALRNREESSEEHVGRLFRFFNNGPGLVQTGFRTRILPEFSARMTPAQRQTASLKLFEERNAVFSCPVPSAVNPAPPLSARSNSVPPRRAPLPLHSAKVVWDTATVAHFCSAYIASGRKLPPGEPAELGSKLDKICEDSRLKP